MVFYFTTSDPEILVYMGRDKHENEHLIKHGWDEDVWFHVDKMSSAHVYLRLKPGMTIDTIPPEVLLDCAQLTKHNSIEGNKANNVVIVYTPWGNLKKTGDMDVGQVSFHNHKAVKRINVDRRDNTIINRLNKTKEEKDPDLAKEKEDRIKSLKRKELTEKKEKERKEKEEMERRKKEKESRTYDNLHDEEKMESNKAQQDFNSFEDDFM
mmetsp:Transcript_1191/g.3345  ORF Transcript_1191/g.3345 Transcript_1191/m.3345 type:complete len:210 (+) Transcript_1191:67-696(+)